MYRSLRSYGRVWKTNQNRRLIMKIELQAGDTITIPEGCKAQINGNEVVVEKEGKEEAKTQEFKDGDILTSKMGTVLVFKEDYGCGQFMSHYNTANFPNSYWFTSSFHNATEEEKQQLFDKMKEQGLRWNAEEKRVEKIRWRAKEGEDYYYITGRGHVVGDEEGGLPEDIERYEFGNYFCTQEQAEEAAKRVKEVLRKYHEEIGE